MRALEHVTRSRSLVLLSVLTLGVVIGRFSSGPPESRAQTTNRAPKGRKAFLSGGERSEKVLREISGILKRMDTRVANIEKIMQQQAKK
ncbi:MAG: hypothetical protein ACE5KM_22105 [Planctomycetaceae bacterium]